jgi:isopentenyl phosphate kinase
MPGGQGPGRPGRVLALKIGGSVATDKERPFSVRLRALEHIAAQLAEAAQRQGLRYGVVLGGGSFGHVVAHEMRSRCAAPAEALSATTMAMVELAQAVADVLAMHGLRPVVYPPHAFCSPRGLRPNCRWEHVATALGLGATPLLYGDAYPCGGDWCIVSGDELAVEMACSLGASHLVYLTDVDGVYGPDGRLLERVRVAELEDQAGSRRTGYDVTGGLARKIMALRENWCSSLRGVWVVNGLSSDDRLLRLLATGETSPATLVTP